jgi:hypothetical protein
VNEEFLINLLRATAASSYFQAGLLAAREMFGKSYFGDGEKVAVDQAVLAYVAGNYQAITPENLAAQQAKQQMGFPIQAPTPNPGTSTAAGP